MLTSATRFAKFLYFDKKISKSMFFHPQNTKTKYKCEKQERVEF